MALPFQLARGFRSGVRAPLARLHYALFTLAAFVFLWGAWFWNMTPLGL